MHFCPRFLNATLIPLLLQSAFRRAFCSFRGISDMHSMIQIFNAAQYLSLFTNEEIEFHSICIPCQDNTAHRGTRNELVFSPDPFLALSTGSAPKLFYLGPDTENLSQMMKSFPSSLSYIRVL